MLQNFGDAELVNSDVTEEKKEDVEVKEETKTEDTAKKPQNQNSSDDYFTKSKLERNVMYSQMIERYQEMINSSSQAPEQKTIAQQEINKINSLQNAIMIAENLLSSKGFEQNIIFVNGNSISVIIGKENLGADEIAQVQNIISRELSAELDNIHISMK